MTAARCVAALCAGALCAGALVAGAFPSAAAPPPGPSRLRSASATSYDGATSHPREDPYYPAKGDPRFDALHYGLHLRWAPAARRLDGVATIRFRAMRKTRSLRLDLGHPLTVRSVALDGHDIPFTHPRNHLDLGTGRLARRSRHTLRIAYTGTPQPAPAPSTRFDLQRVGWTTTRSGSVWTMQEPFGAFTWYPVNDHPSDKAFYDARIDVPARWVGVFNGELRSRTHSGGRTVTRWHLASPAASYLVTIAIGNYVHRGDIGPHGLPITYWVPAHRTGLVRPLRELPTMVRWLESRLGRYPFDRIGAVVVPSDSAMETQTLLTMGSRAYSRGDFRQVILHELAHQWYGDTVTPNNWKDLWLNESFAMYVQVEWATHHGDLPWSYWVSYWKANDQRWRNEDGPPGAYDRGEFGDICVYYCGALMLRELRAKEGAATFDAALRRWVQRRHDTNADRKRYISWLDTFTGRSFGPWIRRWLTAETSPAGR